MDPIQTLADMLQTARAGIVFTGAGISTESGLSDFRSPGGIWSKNKPVMYDDFLRSRQARARYWAMRIELFQELKNSKPNEGHDAVAQLEHKGCIRGVITQNIDGLHQEAGSKRVIEIHGTARQIACVGCRKEYDPAKIVARVREGDDAPDCDTCGAPLKSKTISFGQAMPIALMEEATSLSLGSDLFLAIGSSLVVEPAASLPRLARRNGAKLVIVNRTETPLDELAELVIHRPIGATLQSVLRLIHTAT